MVRGGPSGSPPDLSGPALSAFGVPCVDTRLCGALVEELLEGGICIQEERQW